MARRKKAKVEPPRELDSLIPSWAFDRLEFIRQRLDSLSIGETIVRILKFYDRIFSAVHVEGARLCLLHRNGHSEFIDPEEV